MEIKLHQLGWWILVYQSIDNYDLGKYQHIQEHPANMPKCWRICNIPLSYKALQTRSNFYLFYHRHPCAWTLFFYDRTGITGCIPLEHISLLLKPQSSPLSITNPHTSWYVSCFDSKNTLSDCFCVKLYPFLWKGNSSCMAKSFSSMWNDSIQNHLCSGCEFKSSSLTESRWDICMESCIWYLL